MAVITGQEIVEIIHVFGISVTLHMAQDEGVKKLLDPDNRIGEPVVDEVRETNRQRPEEVQQRPHDLVAFLAVDPYSDPAAGLSEFDD